MSKENQSLKIKPFQLNWPKKVFIQKQNLQKKLNSIKHGVKILNKQNSLDHIQGLVVDKNNKVYKEGRGGTKN